MVRAGSKATTAAPQKRTRKLTKGFRLSRHNLYRQAIVTLIRARAFAFRDRQAKKRQFRRLWIVRINAACRMRGMRYSEFMHGLQLANGRARPQVAVRDRHPRPGHVRQARRDGEERGGGKQDEVEPASRGPTLESRNGWREPAVRVLPPSGPRSIISCL